MRVLLDDPIPVLRAPSTDVTSLGRPCSPPAKPSRTERLLSSMSEDQTNHREPTAK